MAPASKDRPLHHAEVVVLQGTVLREPDAQDALTVRGVDRLGRTRPTQITLRKWTCLAELRVDLIP